MPTTVHTEIIMKLNKAKSLLIKVNKDSSKIKLCALSKDLDTLLYFINDLINTST
jgi:hypothetical protein